MIRSVVGTVKECAPSTTIFTAFSGWLLRRTIPLLCVISIKSTAPSNSSPGTPDLLVNVGRFSMTPQADDRTFGKYRLTGEWIYGSARYKVAWWRFALCGMTSPTTELVFYGGLFAPYFLQHFLIEQIMRYKIVQKGFVLVHGGCVADRGNSVIFPGLGHAGRAALAVQQVQAGRKLQADDYTLVSASGNTYSYPRRLHVFDHTKEAFPEAVRDLKMRHRFSIKVKSLIYYMTLKYGDLDEALQMEGLVTRHRCRGRGSPGGGDTAHGH